MRNLLSYITFVVLVLMASAAFGQQVPQAGTSIDNRAEGVHFYPGLTDSVFSNSNTVSVIIDEQPQINLIPNQRIQSRAGQRDSLAHELTNTGNVAIDVVITAENVGGDDYDLNDVTLSENTDATESVPNVAPAANVVSQSRPNQLTVNIEPGDTFRFEVRATIDNSTSPGLEAQLQIQAKTERGNIVLNNTDIIEVLEGPVIAIEKAAAESNAEQGGVITYLITGSNEGDQAARALNITVDGNPEQQVLLRDQIPANTTFRQVENVPNGQPLYHTQGAPEFEYSSQPPADLSQVDVFAVAYDAIDPGQTFEARFSVTISANAAGRIENIARVNYRDPVDGGDESSSAETNLVEEVLPEYDAELFYFIDDNYDNVSRAEGLGDPLRLQANAAACNENSALRETTTITLESTKTGDIEEFEAMESGPNTGFFRIMPNVPTRDVNEFSVVQGNGIMETEGNDIIVAELARCGQNQDAVTARIMISPYGVIFNSQTNQPEADVTITLIDVTGEGNGGNAGGPATVYGKQGIDEITNEQTTGPNGQFEFPYLEPSTYRIEVETPAGLTFASVVQPSELPAGRTIDGNASYGNEFEHSGTPGPISFDVPVDPAAQGALFVEKTSSTTSAEVGDFVTYQITVANNSAAPARQVRVEDTLPFGFRYQKGTASVNGNSVSDPEGDEGPLLSFNVGDIEGNGSVSLTYRVLLGSGSLKSDGKNTATARSDADRTLESNQAQHTIEVRGGVFTDKGYIIGKVFADINENDVQDKGEAGVPGVRIYLENGSFVVTDSEGMYTFYGINPNKHTLKVDNYTLPQGSRLGILDNRHAGDPSTRFVDLKKGELHRADFAICDLTEAAKDEIEARREEFNAIVTDEVGTSIKRDFNAEDRSQSPAQRRAQASGTVDGAELPGLSKRKNNRTTLTQSSDSAVNDSVLTTPGLTLEEAMVVEKAELGFMGLADNDTLQTAQRRVWAKSKKGSKLILKVNGREIGEDRIGKKGTLAERGMQAYEFIGVKFKPGKNTLTISETDPFGNERGKKEITVFAPGSINNMKLTVPVNDVPADGISTAVVRVELQDKAGVKVKSKVAVTLDVSIGEWQVKDNEPSTPGTQTFIEDGAAEFELQSTIEPQDANVRVSIGVMEEEAVVSFLPDLRPLIAAGIIEGTIRLDDGTSVVPARSADGFERELKSLSYSTDDYTADARAAFFLKGKIKGNLLLTAGFDSEKDDDRLFRDIQPDEFYPVYGESSVKGYDAQSTGRLYVRVDHKKTYALYGDFFTQERHPAKSLGEYNRTQTGLKFHFEKDWARVNVFGSQASSLQRIEEFRGQGLSGPYELEFDDILINSEQIEIITRDRNQPTVILERERLTRFRDYVVEPFTGNIIFKSAVPSLDQELNPVFIRVTYEVEEGAEDYLIGGADGQFKITNFFEVGGSFVEDRNPEDNYRLKSINSTIRLGENTVLIGEAAESTTEIAGTGRGGRVELQHKGNDVNARLFAGQTDENFVNRSSQLGQGRTEAGARGAVRLGGSTRLEGEFLYSSNDTLNTNTTGGLLNVQQQITNDIRAEVGVRYSKQNRSQAVDASGEDITNKNIRGKLTVGVPKVKGASIFGEYEQDINESERKLIAVGGDYNITDFGKLYARHEFISSALGQYTLNGSERRQNTVVGLDANYMQNGQVYSEYRVDNAFDGRNAQAAIGLRNRFEVYEGFGINVGLERVFSLSGDPLNEGTAISTAVDYTANPLWKGTARAEARFSNTGNSYLSTLGYGRKINPNWTFLGKNIFSLQTSSNVGTADRIQQRLRFGFAYRETHQNRWNALGRYELKYEENGQFGGDFNRLVHIFSTNVNYHPSADWTHSGRFAAKKLGESSAEFDSESLTMLLSGRTIHDLNRKLDVGVNASIMSDAGLVSKDFGVGAEVGYVVKRNLRLALGFNVSGFEDRDLAASNYTRKGVYFGFSYKFDERLFKGLVPDEDKNNDLYAACDGCADSKPVPQAATLLKMPEQEPLFKGLQAVDIKAPDFDVETRKTLTTLPKDIHFASDQSYLNTASKEMLDLVAKFLKGQDNFALEITGHTDSRASAAYNLKLSERRAKSVQKYLVSQGVNPKLVDFKGLSENESKTSTENDVVDRSINRRVQLNLDIPNVNVRFIPQINDLQMEKQISKSIPQWDYVFNAKINAVPNRVHVQGDVLNGVTKYLLQRMAMTLQHYTDEEITFNIYAPNKENKAAMITAYMEQIGADMSRVDVQTPWGSTNGHAASGRIDITYDSDSRLESIEQRDDLIFANSTAVQSMLDKILELLKLRQDHLLITKSSK